jgi:hypothetical protein
MNTEFYRRAVAAIGSPWGMAILATVALVSLFAMQYPLHTMWEHGVRFDELQSAGTTAKATEFVATLGEEGREAAWIILAIEFPWIVGFALLISGWCLATADLLSKAGRDSSARALRIAAWAGPIAAACDIVENVAVAFMLDGRTGQPAPRIAEVGGLLTWTFVGIGIASTAAGIALLAIARLRHRGGDPA